MSSSDTKELDVKELIKKRGNLKSRLTNYRKYLSSCENIVLTDRQRTEIKLRVHGLESVFAEFNSIQSDLEMQYDGSDLEKQYQVREQFESDYYEALAQSQCLVNVDDENANTSHNSSNSLAAAVKLPTITLPEFDGTYEQWLEYRDTFLSLVHLNTTISKIQKFHYLKASLKGSAQLVIDSLEFSADNYIIAWDLLLSRYDNTKLLVHNHIKSLFSLPSVNKESPGQIRKLVDVTMKNLRALKLLGESVDHWDTLIIYMIVSKLDQTTERDWEQHKNSLNGSVEVTKVSLDHLMKFLRDKADMLETISVSNKPNHTHDKKQGSFTPKVNCNFALDNTPQPRTKSQPKHSQKRPTSCLMCNENHPLYSCQKFLDLNVQDRRKLITNRKICENCLRPGHTAAECKYGPCRKCEKKHNSLICDIGSETHDRTVAPRSTPEGPSQGQGQAPHGNPSNSNSHTQSYSIQVNNAHSDSDDMHSSVKPVLLSTALVEIPDSLGNLHQARAILDNGSERCFISKSLSDKLHAKIIQSTQQIRGVGNSITQCAQTCSIELRSMNGIFITHIQCLVLPRITSSLPSITLNRNQFSIPNNVTLADPTFYESQPIDILIGADLFWDLLTDGKMRLMNGPYLQNTQLGWIISGSVSNFTQKTKHVNCNFTQSIDMISIDKQVRRFWELEELPIGPKSAVSHSSDEEQACENHFQQTTKRGVDGRFCVRIPFKYSPDTLGETFKQAERRFYALEKRLERYPAYKKLYSDFIHEYNYLGHMSFVNTYGTPHYFMPHHGVFREHAKTTKLRVVFDASAVSSTGQSLNDLQMVGPPIQGDLISILLRFRENRYVACADVEKMYRQVLVDDTQRDLQLILWRDNRSDPLQIYRLNTVTYGTASAPFLSCRCIKQLAQECNNPDVARTVREDFYVDDLITGHSSKETLVQICNDISKTLLSGCLPLRKWVYNFEIDSESHTHTGKDFSVGEYTHSKTLGLGWYPKSDELYFHTQFELDNKQVTKRIILSGASQIYDPLGLLAPVITLAKLLLQKCWLLKLDWDEPLPDDITKVWGQFVNNLSMLNNVQVPRFVSCAKPIYTELNICTDASMTAYGACAYVRTIDKASAVTVRLLTSKGKVASIKPVITIPRLELCGALLGARLYAKIIGSLRTKFDKVVFWTDSMIVLGWLGMSPSLLKAYVQNRAGEIHELTAPHSWHHISSKMNPADLVSRGQHLNALSKSTLWWNGPPFLHDPNFDSSNSQSQSTSKIPISLPEIRSECHSLVTNAVNQDALFPFSRFSQFNRMRRAAAYVLRFIHNARNKSDKRRGVLTVVELSESTDMLARLSQQESFADARDSLIKNGQVNRTQVHLMKLNLFLDNKQLLRVGGRIENSSYFNYDKIHPVLLSCRHYFTILLFRYEHKQLMHAAPQLLLFTLRETWWPVGGRNLARITYHSCIVCTRLRGKNLTPIMGNLPKERLVPGFPFLNCGVDYAGPLLILNRKGRGAKTVKAYVCLFICFVTRAVHLELVGDLSSDAYLLALKRFISRRGKPAVIFSDNGKNFVGLKNEFRKFLESCSDEIKEYASAQNIEFKMVPPYASHFGGLWEAGVKSCKHHLKRVVGNAHLTFEEFSTVLTQVEAILNSRPLTPMSTDPLDFLPLSPAHFLVGRPLTSPACADVNIVPAHRLTRYQRVEQIRQHFWSRWSKEYITELQTRGKWREKQEDLKKNTLVVIKEDNQPPLKWSLGRITDIFPGKDGVARVADIRTANGVTRRAFSKICPLFQPEEKLPSDDSMVKN